MNFELTEEQRQYADTIRRFAEANLQQGALQRAHSPRFPFDIAREMAKQGLLGITFEERNGGQGGRLLDAVLAIEQIGLVCPRSADVIQAGNFGPIRTFIEYATPEQKERFLPDLLRGQAVISLAMSEPDAGSAVTDLRTHIKTDGSSCVLNGSKVFSTHSADASLFLVYARFGPGVNGIGSVLVERDTPGFTIGQPSEFMSGEVWCSLHFDDCRVPKENILLGPGGFKKQLLSFNVERVGNAARSLTLGRYAFNQAREHARLRHQFGRPLCEFQGLQWKFADMALQIDSSQLLLYRAATDVGDNGLPSTYATTMAKASCNLAGSAVANEAVQIMGGLGYGREALVEYCARRTRGWMIAGGSVEILKNRIAEHVFDRRFDQRPPTASPLR